MRLQGSDFVLIVGDIADRADEKQYSVFLDLIDERFHAIPVYCVSGNHDNPARDDTNYRQFERKLNSEYPSIVDECGAFYKCINEHIDLIGLNPLYHQKQFFFPNKGAQIDFLQKRLAASLCKYHSLKLHEKQPVQLKFALEFAEVIHPRPIPLTVLLILHEIHHDHVHP